MSFRNGFLLAAATLLMTAGSAEAAKVPVFVSWGGERIVKVADLPDTDAFRTRSGELVDVGFRFKQVRVLLIPVWNYDVTWCGYVGSDDSYLKLDESELKAMATGAGAPLASDPSLPIWDRFGGKALLLLLMVAWVAYARWRARAA